MEQREHGEVEFRPHSALKCCAGHQEANQDKVEVMIREGAGKRHCNETRMYRCEDADDLEEAVLTCLPDLPRTNDAMCLQRCRPCSPISLQAQRSVSVQPGSAVLLNVASSTDNQRPGLFRRKYARNLGHICDHRPCTVDISYRRGRLMQAQSVRAKICYTELCREISR